jgi:hypothetical protein
MNWFDSFLMTKPLQRAFLRWLTGTWRGRAFGVWASRTIALPQLRRMALQTVPWSPLRQPLAKATVAIVTTSGTHMAGDRPFNLNSDATFCLIPRTAEPADLTIAHVAHDRTDALRNLNLVFLLQLPELEAEGIIGRVAERHYASACARRASSCSSRPARSPAS